MTRELTVGVEGVFATLPNLARSKSNSQFNIWILQLYTTLLSCFTQNPLLFCDTGLRSILTTCVKKEIIITQSVQRLIVEERKRADRDEIAFSVPWPYLSFTNRQSTSMAVITAPSRTTTKQTCGHIMVASLLPEEVYEQGIVL